MSNLLCIVCRNTVFSNDTKILSEATYKFINLKSDVSKEIKKQKQTAKRTGDRCTVQTKSKKKRRKLTTRQFDINIERLKIEYVKSDLDDTSSDEENVTSIDIAKIDQNEQFDIKVESEINCEKQLKVNKRRIFY